MPLENPNLDQDLLPTEKQRQIDKHRKTILLKDAQKKKAAETKGAMRKYIASKMKEMASTEKGGGANDSIMSLMSHSDSNGAEAEKRNAAIFRNLTFDMHGNPLHI